MTDVSWVFIVDVVSASVRGYWATRLSSLLRLADIQALDGEEASDEQIAIFQQSPDGAVQISRPAIIREDPWTEKESD